MAQDGLKMGWASWPRWAGELARNVGFLGNGIRNPVPQKLLGFYDPNMAQDPPKITPRWEPGQEPGREPKTFENHKIKLSPQANRHKFDGYAWGGRP